MDTWMVLLRMIDLGREPVLTFSTPASTMWSY